MIQASLARGIAAGVESVDDLAKRERLDSRSVRRLIRLGVLSPRIVEAIAEGRQPPDLTVIGLSRRVDLLSLPKIPSELEFESSARIAVELIRLNETC